MFQKRLSGHSAMGYARGEAPFGYAEVFDELVTECEEGLAGPDQDVDTPSPFLAAGSLWVGSGKHVCELWWLSSRTPTFLESCAQTLKAIDFPQVTAT
jgi:hypothetical protein